MKNLPQIAKRAGLLMGMLAVSVWAQAQAVDYKLDVDKKAHEFSVKNGQDVIKLTPPKTTATKAEIRNGLPIKYVINYQAKSGVDPSTLGALSFSDQIASSMSVLKVERPLTWEGANNAMDFTTPKLFAGTGFTNADAPPAQLSTGVGGTLPRHCIT